MGDDSEIKDKHELIPGLNKIKIVSGLIAALGVIAGSVIAVESRYAHAEDIKTMINNQTTTLKTIQSQQKQQLMYQIDTWDFQIKKLEEQKKIMEASKQRMESQSAKKANERQSTWLTVGPTPTDLDNQISTLKIKRDAAVKILVTE